MPADKDRIGPSAGLRLFGLLFAALGNIVLEGRGHVGVVRLPPVDLTEPNESVWLGVRQRAEQHAVDDAEDRRRRANAESER